MSLNRCLFFTQLFGFYYGLLCGDAALSCTLPLQHDDAVDGVSVVDPISPVVADPGTPRSHSDGLPRVPPVTDVIYSKPFIVNTWSTTSAPDAIKDFAADPRISGQNSGNAGMSLNRCLFFTQVGYIPDAYSYRSDDRFLLLLFCPNSLVACCSRVLHYFDGLLLSGDVELNPGPRGVASANTAKSTEVTTPLASSTSSSTSFPTDTANLLAQLLDGQKKIASDIADIKETFNSRFEALETRVCALESSAAITHYGATSDKLNSEIASLRESVTKLSLKSDDLENRSRRNNILLHGLPETRDENTDSLLNAVTQVLSERLHTQCPDIERCHRIGRSREGRPRPVIMKIFDYREKVRVMKNVSSLKGSGLYITEDLSPNVRALRKKLWDATASYRDKGSRVKLRYDHAYIDDVRYIWDNGTDSLKRDSTGAAKEWFASKNKTTR
uniref:Putative tick transposon n=1 Tax=Rhipicephalus pulchellus TaxID=72859 RepID=L7LVY4_RHIPC